MDDVVSRFFRALDHLLVQPAQVHAPLAREQIDLLFQGFSIEVGELLIDVGHQAARDLRIGHDLCEVLLGDSSDFFSQPFERILILDLNICCDGSLI